MNSKFDILYGNSPCFLQNTFISLYGLYLNTVRHGKYYNVFLNKIERNVSLSATEFRQLQIESLRKLLQESVQHVPYYRNCFSADAVRGCNDLSDLRKFPLLEKSVVRQHPEQLVDERYDLKKLNVVHTTGTTGTPLKIYCTPRVRKRNYAFYTRFLSRAGINYKGKRITIGGRVVVSADQKTAPFWRHSLFQKNVLFSSYHLSDEFLPQYIHKIKELQSEYIDSYPSSLYSIAAFAEKSNTSLRGSVKAITTSAETLFPEQRRVIERVFGVPVFDQYGAAEMCAFIGQCSAGNYHIHSDYAILELLRDDGTTARPGEEAEIVCTGLINDVMPLIRYRIGDRAVLSDQPCRCGCSFPVVSKLIGRADDVIRTPRGGRIGRLSPVLKNFPVKEAQYRQQVLDEVEVLIVRDHGFDADTEHKVVLELEKRLGTDMQITVKYVQAIDRSAGGKFKSIVSSLDEETI